MPALAACVTGLEKAHKISWQYYPVTLVDLTSSDVKYCVISPVFEIIRQIIESSR